MVALAPILALLSCGAGPAQEGGQFRLASAGTLTATPRYGLSAELTAEGLRASARADSVALATVAYGRRPLGGGEPALGGCAGEPAGGACVRPGELDHGPITEWWVGRGAGLEHGWTLRAPPDGGPVTLTVAVSEGALVGVDEDGVGATLRGSAGGLWRYEDLEAWDADGVGLPARMVAEGGRIRVEVDASGARWPVTVDPALWTETKLAPPYGKEGDAFGVSVSGAGDLNGDGWADLVIGADEDDDLGADAGAAFVYYGSSSGILRTARDELHASDGEAGDAFGRSVSGAGDLDGDGYDDLVVGAWGDDDLGSTSGAVYVYFGSATGIDTASETKLTASDGAALDGFGYSVSSAGDVDGDGYADLIVGAFADSDKGAWCGSAYVYFGSPSGVGSASAQKLSASDGAAEDVFGASVAGAGDVNGDGYDDLVVGAWGDDDEGVDSGSIYVYLGSATGVDGASERKLTASDGQMEEQFGLSVAGGGDLNGDGYDDVVAGASGDEENGWMSGSIYVYYGSGSGMALASEDKILASDGTYLDRFGFVVAGAGDVDRDGYADLLVGAYYDGKGGSSYIYYGSAGGVDNALEDKLTASDRTFLDSFGASVAGAGDVNGDGFADVVVGAPDDDDEGESSGAAYIYVGGCRDLALDGDGDGFVCEVDCHDNDASSFPGAASTDSTTACMSDADDDGYGDDSPERGVSAGADCDDGDPSVSPEATTEGVGDEVDQDCDGAEICFSDADDDGYIDLITTVLSEDADCLDAGEGAAADPTGECDDVDARAYPGAAWKESTIACMSDADGDGFGARSPTGSATAGSDCDDGDAATFPGAAPSDSPTACMTDGDGDGFGADSPGSGVSGGTDCDDADPGVSSAAAEVCDGVDNDCDGTADNDDAVDADAWFADADGDGFGDPDVIRTGCVQPEGTTRGSTDCDDADPAVRPGAREVEGDGIDQDCDGADAPAEVEGPEEEGGCGGCATSHAPDSLGLLVLFGALVVGRGRRPESRIRR